MLFLVEVIAFSNIKCLIYRNKVDLKKTVIFNATLEMRLN